MRVCSSDVTLCRECKCHIRTFSQHHRGHKCYIWNKNANRYGSAVVDKLWTVLKIFIIIITIDIIIIIKIKSPNQFTRLKILYFLFRCFNFHLRYTVLINNLGKCIVYGNYISTKHISISMRSLFQSYVSFCLTKYRWKRALRHCNLPSVLHKFSQC